MTKFCVKKPYFIIVAVIIVLTVGFVSLGKMQTDLMPDMEIPYMMIITTQPGASPEQVENDVTKPVENAVGVINGVENLDSSSAENYSIVTLEFAEDTDINAALVRVSKALNAVELPEECGSPNIMEVSMDMVATMYASVEYRGKSIQDISTFTEKTVKPYLERQNGVASISGTGLVDRNVEIRLDQKKIDKVNGKILLNVNGKLADAKKELDDAQSKLEDGKRELAKQKKQLKKQQKSANKKLGKASVKLGRAQAVKVAYESALNSLNASKAALEAEKKAYTDADAQDNYAKMDQMFAQFTAALSVPAKQSGVEIPVNVEDAAENKEKFEKFAAWMRQAGYGEHLGGVTYDSIAQLNNIVNVRIPQIDAELANLGTEIAASKQALDAVKKQMKGINGQYSEAVAGGYSSAATFGAAEAQIAAGEKELENAKAKLKDSRKQFKESEEAAKEQADIDALLSLETLSNLISAQNFSMPAGYVHDKDDRQWIVKVGEKYTNEKQLADMALTKVPGAGTVRLSDVADVTMVDTSGESYAKMNGRDAVLLSIYKASTANTGEVSENLTSAFKELEDKYDGLDITPMINQGDYITMMVKSIVTSILLGALLAVLVLALFLRDVKPTLIVAFSIPFSVLFAVIIMYFTGMTLNVMSLAGLCLGIGMLVDNSIVVIENIYRLKNYGMSAARAAVQGARQVAAPIIASTLTTICVFFPMVYVTGIISQLLIPFAFTISYALFASLLVALTVVPTVASLTLKNAKQRTYKWFEALKNGYAKLLNFCLRFKVLPLSIAIILFALCVFETTRTGIVMISDTESRQIMITMTLDDKTEKEEAYRTADDVAGRLSGTKGVRKVGVMDGNAGAASDALGGSEDNYTTFLFFVMPDEDLTTVGELKKIRKDVEKSLEGVRCKEMTVASSALGSAASMMSQGMQVNIYGSDQEKLTDISRDVMKMMKKTGGMDNITNGIEEGDKQILLDIDKDEAARCGLTVAQIYQQISEQLSTDRTAMTLSVEDDDVDVHIIDETDALDYDNILNAPLTASVKNEDGKTEEKSYKLSKFAELSVGDSPATLTRQNQTQYMSVTADTKEGYNTTLLSRDLQKKIDAYKVPDGYSIEIEGETEQVMDMVKELCQAIALGFLLIYLVMVAQFQSLLSPLIILFTVPLAFTGGMIGLIIFREPISAIALMGFMVLMGTVVNNGIVFVDYVNKLRLQGLGKREALIATGKVRMRPILMTAMTTIFSMSVMVFSQDAGNALQKPMAVVVCFGLIYATFMTLFIVPVMYDIFYRRTPGVVDVGDDDLDAVPDETAEYLKNENAASAVTAAVVKNDSNPDVKNHDK